MDIDVDQKTRGLVFLDIEDNLMRSNSHTPKDFKISTNYNYTGEVSFNKHVPHKISKKKQGCNEGTAVDLRFN